MKKYLLLVLIVLALFTIDHPLIKEPRDKLLQQGVDTLGETSQTQYSLAAKQARHEIAREIELSASEQAYLLDALATDEKVKVFHVRFCQEHELNLYFFGPKLNTICDIAAKAIKKAEF
ncbi:hypothetical protein N473_07845 [Pseudoalteromonas luteoviolacea CPMOR-1]|uniref:Uncharacterized protein n=2 Tax=Pseudoalteromonas luteoviolacea TaxID=43657 RepID=A0A167MXX6_9GAMM|nr:hypothetical protein [Pseudoalteromonas luteoviolacea]KID59113.1 hypothetical protein JF50_01260 [Pseudoalteromonas luteoviolacea]KZN67123.1 hypothetical protein N473_07845 [Pseudoalteromonas luteoviolacea CPMOR-1]